MQTTTTTQFLQPRHHSRAAFCVACPQAALQADLRCRASEAKIEAYQDEIHVLDAQLRSMKSQEEIVRAVHKLKKSVAKRVAVRRHCGMALQVGHAALVAAADGECRNMHAAAEAATDAVACADWLTALPAVTVLRPLFVRCRPSSLPGQGLAGRQSTGDQPHAQ